MGRGCRRLRRRGGSVQHEPAEARGENRGGAGGIRDVRGWRLAGRHEPTGDACAAAVLQRRPRGARGDVLARWGRGQG